MFYFLLLALIPAAFCTDDKVSETDPGQTTTTGAEASDTTNPKADSSDTTNPKTDPSDTTNPKEDPSDTTNPKADPSDTANPKADASDTPKSDTDPSVTTPEKDPSEATPEGDSTAATTPETEPKPNVQTDTVPETPMNVDEKSTNKPVVESIEETIDMGDFRPCSKSSPKNLRFKDGTESFSFRVFVDRYCKETGTETTETVEYKNMVVLTSGNIRLAYLKISNIENTATAEITEETFASITPYKYDGMLAAFNVKFRILMTDGKCKTMKFSYTRGRTPKYDIEEVKDFDTIEECSKDLQ